MPRHVLSSARTAFYKYVFPAMWILGFGSGTATLWLTDQFAPPPPPEMKWMFLAMWWVGTTFILWFARSLKRVAADDTTLFVSGYSKEVSIPLVDIERVRKRPLFNPRTIVITFKHDTDFGRRVTFIPPWTLRLSFADPAETDLRERVQRAGGSLTT
jgi:hypothetical protein